MNEVIKKVCIALGYALLAGYSAFMTATSVSLKWNLPFVMAFIIVFIFALICGYSLNAAIKEMKNDTNPSVFKIIKNICVFLAFWIFSFATNVHYNVIQQHGYDNINQKLRSCIVYLDSATNKASLNTENEIRNAKQEIRAKIGPLTQKFHNSLDPKNPSFPGFGPDCKTLLQQIAKVLNDDNALHDDKSTYVVYDESYHDAYLGTKGYKECLKLQTKFDDIISGCLSTKDKAIDDYYASITMKKDLIDELKTVADSLDKNELAKLEGKDDFKALYSCYKSLKKNVFDKMPDDYKAYASRMVQDKGGDLRYVLYPSENMFDFMTMWGDWWNDRIPEAINPKGQFLWSFLVDFASFLIVSIL